jgi:hypothetical protein
MFPHPPRYAVELQGAARLRRPQAIVMASRPTELDGHVAAIDKTVLAEALAEGCAEPVMLNQPLAAYYRAGFR